MANGRPSLRPWAIAAAIAGYAMVAVYVALIVAQGDTPLGLVVPWVLAMTTAATLALVAAPVSADQAARRLLFIAAAIFLVIGFLGVLTIGLGFLIAGGLAIAGATRLGTDDSDVSSEERLRLEARTREIMAETGLAWRKAWRRAVSEGSQS
jgi:hypothetical protein